MVRRPASLLDELSITLVVVDPPASIPSHRRGVVQDAPTGVAGIIQAQGLAIVLTRVGVVRAGDEGVLLGVLDRMGVVGHERPALHPAPIHADLPEVILAPQTRPTGPLDRARFDVRRYHRDRRVIEASRPQREVPRRALTRSYLRWLVPGRRGDRPGRSTFALDRESAGPPPRTAGAAAAVRRTAGRVRQTCLALPESGGRGLLFALEDLKSREGVGTLLAPIARAAPRLVTPDVLALLLLSVGR
mmetsp:Transcript_29609/g.66429  ORF Transcript_29609/g.66429 Transcript_29609/m.66429 type:complete len:246 (+) Transcript_29609:2793-3530(+)